jgi:hypothetical protein
MATLAVQTVDRSGLDPTFAAVAAGGDQFLNTGGEFVVIKNANAATRTVTFVTQQTVDSEAVADKAVVVPGTGGGGMTIAGPFPTKVYNHPTTGRVSMTYSDSGADLTVAICALA